MRRRYKVYLAGPITGCNADQKTLWRRRVRERWASDFDFIDPTDAKADVSKYEIVSRDERAIEGADAVLANMWKESVGTSIGVVLAKRAGKPVVVIDPNHLNSTILTYWSDASDTTEEGAMRKLRDLFRAQEHLEMVIKLNKPRQRFKREKLAQSIRRACADARQNDVVATAEIVPRVIRRLCESPRVQGGEVPSSEIKRAIVESMRELEADPTLVSEFEGIREAWERHEGGRRRSTRVAAVRDDAWIPSLSEQPLDVRVWRGGKSHKNIWNKKIMSLADLPDGPRRLFEEMCRVEGIAEIRFTVMGQSAHTGAPRIELRASKDAGIIDGICFDKAKWGGKQMFRLIVHDKSRRDAILAALTLRLRDS